MQRRAKMYVIGEDILSQVGQTCQFTVTVGLKCGKDIYRRLVCLPVLGSIVFWMGASSYDCCGGLGASSMPGSTTVDYRSQLDPVRCTGGQMVACAGYL